MTIFHKIAFIFLSLSIANCGAVTDSRNSSPDDIDSIGLFTDNKVIAINNSGDYLIGKTRGSWPVNNSLKKIGLEFVSLTLSNDKGVYLVGGTTFKTKDDITATRGKTVLINSSNKVIETWEYDATFNSAVLRNGEVIGSTGNTIYHLLNTGEVKTLHNRNKKIRSTLISVALDNKGDLITCNPFALKKSNTPFMKFGCRKGTDWEFEGQWHGSTTQFNTEPVSCGKWLIETEQKHYNTPITRLKVRELETGKLVKEKAISDVSRFICLDGKSIMLNTGLIAYSLPDLTPDEKYSCIGDESIKSIKHNHEVAVCLTDNGNIGELKKLKSID